MCRCHLFADFGLNILSLDDLAPDTTSKAEELKQNVSRNSPLAYIPSLPLVECGGSKINNFTGKRHPMYTRIKEICEKRYIAGGRGPGCSKND